MANRIQGTTTLLGLIGTPLKHSKSPHMHNTSFEVLGLDYVYMAFEVPDGCIKESLDALKILNAEGFNITMPHKKKVLEYAKTFRKRSQYLAKVHKPTAHRGMRIFIQRCADFFFVPQSQR